MHRQRRNKAFTLIELLVVISIIAVLVALLLPALSKAKQVAVKSENMSNMKTWSNGLVSYAMDNDQFFPYNGQDEDQLIHGEVYPGVPIRGGEDTSWCSTDVQYMWKNYMMPNFTSAKRGDNNVLYNPTQEWHRVNDTSLIGGLCGYFYWPRRIPNSLNMEPETIGYQTKQRFDEGADAQTNGVPKFKYPILQDQVQAGGLGSVWIDPGLGVPYSSWPDRGGIPEGGHSLFEDGHVQWDAFSEIEYGAQVDSWHYFFLLEL